MEPLPSGEYILVVVDYYSRCLEVDILTSLTSPTVIESLEKIFCTHGLPESLKTGNRTPFVSDEFERFLKTNDIEQRTLTPLWPQANEEVERQNRSFLKALWIAKAENKNVWTEMRKFLTKARERHLTAVRGSRRPNSYSTEKIMDQRFPSWENRGTPTVRQETRTQR